ncbi:MAG TPA: hypothetical protein VG734_24900 [Lacunisphaera sp.]|nr:hypothetical protein [Lacunisphaera sp.]
MRPPRCLLWSCTLILALALAGCGKKEEPAKAAPPKPAQVAPPPAPAKPEGPPQPEKGAKAHASLEGLAAARIDGGYVRLLYQTGQKSAFPVTSLSDSEAEWLKDFIKDHPLAAGKSTVVVAKVEAKKTIEKQETKDGTETVQLVAPAKLRDQIGGTCMFYARVHYLDIAGYGVADGEIYQVINNVPKNNPYDDYRYHVGMQLLFLKQKPTPIAYYPDGTIPPFEWARQQLRKGRPILAALPENIWLSLPADYLAQHPWEGNNKIGHQVVINGFSYNPTTKKSTFHVVNSWRSLAEFDVTVEARDEKNVLMEQSLAPKGELPEQAEKIVAGAITLVRAVGKQNLYSIETNKGPKKVTAATEDDAKRLVEMDTSAPDPETAFGEYVVRACDYIHAFADPKIRDQAIAQLVSEVCRVPAGVALPHVDLEVKNPLGRVYLVRVAPEKIVKLGADSPEQALQFAARIKP